MEEVFCKTHKYRLYPTRQQIEQLEWTLARCCDLYNTALQERKWSWTYEHRPINFAGQSAQLPELKDAFPEYKDIYAQVLQDVLHRVDKTYQAFFRRVKSGEKAGYPRYQRVGRFDSFTYPQAGRGFSLTHDNRLCLAKIGTIKVKMHREMQGKIKTCTIKRESNEWYVVFVCEVQACPKLPYTDEVVGIDLGVSKLATLSTGTVIEHPRYYRRAEKKLKEAQQALSRKKRGGNRRKKVVQRVAKLHRKVRRQRANFLHQEAKWLVDTYATIVFEDLNTSGLTKAPKPKQNEDGKYLPNGASAKAGLNKSIRDAGWGTFVRYCQYKAEWAGTVQVVFVNPHMTSQVCSNCGAVVKKDLSERWHSCECGCELDRDHNAAINIKNRWLGRSLQVSA